MTDELQLIAWRERILFRAEWLQKMKPCSSPEPLRFTFIQMESRGQDLSYHLIMSMPESYSRGRRISLNSRLSRSSLLQLNLSVSRHDQRNYHYWMRWLRRICWSRTWHNGGTSALSKLRGQGIKRNYLPDNYIIWITNTGIESSRSAISFKELHGLLSQMHSLAQKLIRPTCP